MTEKLLVKPTIIHLSRQKDRRFVVPTGSRWTEKQVIEACEGWEHAKKIVDRAHEHRQQVKLLLERLWRWLGEHGDKVEEGYLSIRPDRQLFLVVLPGLEFNPELEAALTELSFEVGNSPDLKMIRLDVQSLPKCEHDDVRSFLEPDEAPDSNGEFPVAR